MKRAKKSRDGMHPLKTVEIEALRKLKRVEGCDYVFLSERNTPLSSRAVQNLIVKLGEKAGFGFAIHAHMLRHACGYKLANDGVDTREGYLGHRDIRSTVIYTDLSPRRFDGFFED